MDDLLEDNSGRAATTAPTNDGTLAKLIYSGPMNDEQQAFTNLMAQFYAINGQIMTLAVARDRYFFDDDEFLELINNSKVQAALTERGINLGFYKEEGFKRALAEATTGNESSGVGHEPEPAWRQYSLSPLQLLVANTMLDLVDTRSQKKKLQDMGVNSRVYATWLKDENFQGYLQARAEAMLGENQHEAHLALLDKVRMGDIKAITYYNELTGRYVAERASNAGVGTNAVLDFKNLLIRILEIINDEVTDPDVAMAIAERFKTLMSVNHIADDLLDLTTPIVTPDIEANRVLNPRLQSILNKGEEI